MSVGNAKLYHPLGHSYEAHPDTSVSDIAQVEDSLVALVPCFPDGVVRPGAQRLTVAEHGTVKLGAGHYRIVLPLTGLYSSQQATRGDTHATKPHKQAGPSVTDKARSFLQETANHVQEGYSGARENAQSVAHLLGVKAEEYRTFASNKAVEWKDFFNEKAHEAYEGVAAAQVAVVNSFQKALSDITTRLHDWRTKGQTKASEAPRETPAEEQTHIKDGIWKRVEDAVKEMKESVKTIKDRSLATAETKGEHALETLKEQWRVFDEKLHETEKVLRERTQSLLATYFGSSHPPQATTPAPTEAPTSS